MNRIHRPIDHAENVYVWFKKSQIDYGIHFLSLYVSYNAWYCEATQVVNDRDALAKLKKRFVIWDDYCKGLVLTQLAPYMKRLTELTQQEPCAVSHIYWNGEVEDEYDWRSLIEFWYQMRCLIVHGADFSMKYAWLAYETLAIFMDEITKRMQACVTEYDLEGMRRELAYGDASEKTVRFHHLQRKLFNKYIDSPNIWHVDMERVQKSN